MLPASDIPDLTHKHLQFGDDILEILKPSLCVVPTSAHFITELLVRPLLYLPQLGAFVHKVLKGKEMVKQLLGDSGGNSVVCHLSLLLNIVNSF